jgi:hypothetical protein
MELNPHLDRIGLFAARSEGESAWMEFAKYLFVPITGGRNGYWNDFEYVFWKWLVWVFEKEGFESDVDFQGILSELDRPEWFED